MALLQSFFHLLRFLTVDFIPSVFKQKIKFNQDHSGVYFDNQKNNSKNIETVYYSADSTIISEELKKEIFEHSYTGHVVVAVLVHILSFIASLSFSAVPFTLKLVIYIVAAAGFKLFLNFLYHSAQKLNFGGVYSGEFIHLPVEQNLAERSRISDRINALSHVGLAKSANKMSFERRAERNSDYIKIRVIAEQSL